MGRVWALAGAIIGATTIVFLLQDFVDSGTLLTMGLCVGGGAVAEELLLLRNGGVKLARPDDDADPGFAAQAMYVGYGLFCVLRPRLAHDHVHVVPLAM